MAEPDTLRASGPSQAGGAPTSAPRRRLSPDERRNELLTLGAEVFGQRPYDEVRIDEIAEKAGVSRALMYHYFPDKRAFFAAVLRAEGERLFEATNAPPKPGLGLFDQLREGVIAYLRYYEENPNVAWAAYVGAGRSDPVLRGIEDIDTDRQVDRIVAAFGGDRLNSKVERDLRIIAYGCIAFTLEMCRQRMMDPSIDIGRVADACAHTILDAVARVPGIPEALAEAIAAARPLKFVGALLHDG